MAAPLSHTRRCAGQSFCSHPAHGQENMAVESRLLLLLPQCDTKAPASHLGRKYMQMGVPAPIHVPQGYLVVCTLGRSHQPSFEDGMIPTSFFTLLLVANLLSKRIFQAWATVKTKHNLLDIMI